MADIKRLTPILRQLDLNRIDSEKNRTVGKILAQEIANARIPITSLQIVLDTHRSPANQETEAEFREYLAKLEQERMTKAEQDATRIIDSARREAEEIVKDARARSDQFYEKRTEHARREAEAIRHGIHVAVNPTDRKEPTQRPDPFSRKKEQDKAKRTQQSYRPFYER